MAFEIRKALTRFGLFAIPAATLLGVASPLCACATLPLVISLLVAGLPLAPAMALLVTSPLMSPASFSMISGMLGVNWALTVLVCAVLLGMFAGYVTHFLRGRGFAEKDIFRKALPQGDFHDPDYPVEQLRWSAASSCHIELIAARTTSSWVPGALLGGQPENQQVRPDRPGDRSGRAALYPQRLDYRYARGTGIAPIFTLTLAAIPLLLPQVTAASMLFGFYLPDPGQVIPLAKGAGVAMLVGGPVTAVPAWRSLYRCSSRECLCFTSRSVWVGRLFWL